MQHHLSEQTPETQAPADDFNPLVYREPEDAANDNEPAEGLNARDLTLITKGVHFQIPMIDEESLSFDEDDRGELNFAETRTGRRGFLDEPMG